jgi:putative tryptophan/tyrosine transport system substrate-binding protein
MEAFRQGLSESGYVEGQNLTVELRFAEGGVERLPQLAAQLVHLNVQVVVTIGTLATSAVQRTATTIPIVALADELVRPGLVASVARPGGNTTGVQILAPEVSAKRLELLKQIVPVVSRVAVLSDPGQGLPQVPPLEEAARSLGVQLRVLEVRGEGDIEGAFQAAKGGRAGAIHVLASPRLFAYSKTIVGLAAKHRLPVIYEWREAVEAGGLASYGPILSEMWRQTARVVGKVLNGAKPADLPVEQPTKFELVINLKTAKALGLTIPPSVLARADEVIQ